MTTLRYMILLCYLCCALGAVRAAAVCEQAFGGGTGAAYMTWETAANGDVVITISGDQGTAFRANGMGKDLSRFTVGGQPAANYFRRKYTTGGTTYTLELISTANRPADGTAIVYDGSLGNMEWRTSGNTNAWGAISFSYTYGTGCAQLDAPTIASIDANKRLHIATPAPAGAGKYALEVYRDEFLVYTGTVQDGGVIPFSTTNSATYTVYARALAAAGGVLRSERSEAYLWNLQVTPLETYPVSAYCDKQVSSGNGGVNLTIETDSKGRVVFTLGGGKQNVWRNNGIKLDGMTIYGEPASRYFSKIPGYLGSNQLILEPTAEGKAKLRPADPIVHDANIEWTTYDTDGTVLNNNGYTGVKFTHLYGQGCTVRQNLPAPELVSIAEDGTVIFTPSANADGYLYRIYYEGELQDEDTIASGEQIPYHSYIDRTYDVVIVAVTDGGSVSQESNTMAWVMMAEPDYLPASPLCTEPFGTTADNMAELTWETDAAGNVVIMISGEAGTSFRGGGMGKNLDDFTVEGRPASDYFDRQLTGVYYTLVLRDPAVRPAIGGKIRYRGSADYVEWRTPNDNNAYHKFDWDYIYGTVCPKLATPEIASVSPDGVLTLVADVEDATEYEVVVYRGELMVYTAMVQNGGTIGFVPNVTALYSVQVRARGEGIVPSAYSQPYSWQQVVTDYDIPQSEVCDMVVDNTRGITLTAETTPGDSIVFTLHGGAVWRKNGDDAGLDKDNLMLFGTPAENFWEWLNGYEGDSVLVLIPRPAAKRIICHGDVLSYSPTLYYAYGEETPYKTVRFSYTYGSTCEPQRERLATPVVQAVTDEGVLTFGTVTGAASYEARILDADGDVLVEQTVVSGTELPRERLIVGGNDYCVKVRALPEDETQYRPSYWSECTQWVPSKNDNDNPNDNPNPDDPDLPDSPDKPEPTVPEDPDPDSHGWPTEPVVPTVEDTLAGETDPVPDVPQTVPDTIYPTIDPDTIPVTVVDTLADDTDPIPEPPTAEALDEVAEETNRARKVWIDGQVYIIVDDRRYNMLGQLAE